jgi:hypothetical protein
VLWTTPSTSADLLISMEAAWRNVSDGAATPGTQQPPDWGVVAPSRGVCLPALLSPPSTYLRMVGLGSLAGWVSSCSLSLLTCGRVYGTRDSPYK